MQERTLIEVVAALSGLLLTGLNLAATWRISRSPQLERSQRIGQTIFVWLVPGGFVAIRYLLDPPKEPYSDPTVPRNLNEVDWPPGLGGGGH